jgi:hypothetical protein
MKVYYLLAANFLAANFFLVRQAWRVVQAPLDIFGVRRLFFPPS